MIKIIKVQLGLAALFFCLFSAQRANAGDEVSGVTFKSAQASVHLDSGNYLVTITSTTYEGGCNVTTGLKDCEQYGLWIIYWDPELFYSEVEIRYTGHDAFPWTEWKALSANADGSRSWKPEEADLSGGSYNWYYSSLHIHRSWYDGHYVYLPVKDSKPEYRVHFERAIEPGVQYGVEFNFHEPIII